MPPADEEEVMTSITIDGMRDNDLRNDSTAKHH